MSQWDKLLKKILTMDNNLRFRELQKILESYGYTLSSPRSGSSHCTFRKTGREPITIPKNEPIKLIYVKMVREVIEKENKDEES